MPAFSSATIRASPNETATASPTALTTTTMLDQGLASNVGWSVAWNANTFVPIWFVVGMNTKYPLFASKSQAADATALVQAKVRLEAAVSASVAVTV